MVRGLRLKDPERVIERVSDKLLVFTGEKTGTRGLHELVGGLVTAVWGGQILILKDLPLVGALYQELAAYSAMQRPSGSWRLGNDPKLAPHDDLVISAADTAALVGTIVPISNEAQARAISPLAKGLRADPVPP